MDSIRSRPAAGRLLNSDTPGDQGGFHLASTHLMILPGDVKLQARSSQSQARIAPVVKDRGWCVLIEAPSELEAVF